jgi:hypothetical protein
MLGAASLTFGQNAVPLREGFIAATQERIRALDGRLLEIQDATQKQLDAANCRVDCPEEVGQRLGKEMVTAMDVVLSQIHAEVEGFVLRTADTRQPDLNKGSVAEGLEQILPKSGLPRAVFVLKSANRRSLVVVYALYKGHVNDSSVAIRAYNETTNGLRLADVAGDDMNGYGGLSVAELHSPVGKLSLLLSGVLMGANGHNNRMRIYAYDGERFRHLWMPENVWGTFDITVTNNGFAVEGDYYRDVRKRRDRYFVDEGGVTLIDWEQK